MVVDRLLLSLAVRSPAGDTPSPGGGSGTPPPAVARLFALEALLELLEACADELVPHELGAPPPPAPDRDLLAVAARDAACPTLAALETLFTWPALAALLAFNCAGTAPARRVLALFARELALPGHVPGREALAFETVRAMRDAALRLEEFGLAHALVTEARCSSALLLAEHIEDAAGTAPRVTPCAAYIEFACARTVEALMHANAEVHQCCRLLLALRLDSPLAARWAAQVRLMRAPSCGFWKYTRARLYVVAVDAAVLRYTLAFAALVGARAYIAALLATHSDVLLDGAAPSPPPPGVNRHFWYSSTPANSTTARCPFTCQRACCGSLFDASAYRAAASLLPPALAPVLDAFRVEPRL